LRAHCLCLNHATCQETRAREEAWSDNFGSSLYKKEYVLIKNEIGLTETDAPS
jgi:hypothetical protein